ncbi:hypothetical protein [Pseudomonas sp. B22129]|uniref:hypothetical protein n=1 Tax=Pseudomonas sp. B22129 TaxID=3235111 RepID=UPI003782EF0D
MSYLDKELISDLKKHNINFAVLSQAEHEFMVSEINERLPFSGNKIAWSTLDNSINLGFESTGMAIELLAAEIKKVANNNLIFIGDSACDDAYSISIEHINQALGIFSELPQHTYIVSKPISWIACISFEGHLDFANLYNEFK